MALPDTPYIGLAPYAEKDAPIFSGRETETEVISANLMASRLTVLYGASGVGKSSVLRAGVAYHLRHLARRNTDLFGAPEIAVVVFRNWRGNPVVDLETQVEEAVTQQLADQPSDGRPSEPVTRLDNLVETLGQWPQRIGGDLLIILDQFEEYFLYHEQQDGEGTFAVEFPRALNRSGLRVNFIISIREDALAKLDSHFKGRIRNLFDNRLVVNHLDREAARKAIEEPIVEYNRLRTDAGNQIRIEPALVDEVLKQIEVGQVILGEAGRGGLKDKSAEPRIETPYLQLVMTRLWEEEMRHRSSILRLETLNRLGGAESIVRTHLDATMSALSSDERDIAARIFLHLVTPSGTKIAHIAPDLGQMAGVNLTQLSHLMEKLSTGDTRILRTVAPPLDRPDTPRYEIFHDVLAPAILDWRTRHVRDQELAEAERGAEEERRRAEQKARVETQAKANVILRRWLWILAFMTLSTAAALVFAYVQYGKAHDNEQKALAAQGLAEERLKLAEEKSEEARKSAEQVVEVNKFYDDVIPVLYELIYNGERKQTLNRLNQALENYQRIGDRKREAVTLATIGYFYHSRRQDAIAQKYYEDALSVLKDLLGPEHLYVATMLDELATIYSGQGNYAKAEGLEEQALTVLERVRGEQHADTTTARNNLALIYFNQGKYDQAESLYNRALDIDMKVRGPDDVEVASDLNNLALLYFKQRKYAEAQSQFERALDIWKKNLGEENTTVADGLNSLAEVYRKQGEYTEAEPRARKALEIWERNLSGPDDANLAPSLNILGMIYSDEGKYGDAELLLKRALAIREKALGPVHEKLAISLNGLAVLYYRQGKYTQAEQLFKRALAIREKALGPDHPDVAETLEDYAALLSATGREAEAAKMKARSKDIRDKHLN